MVLPSRIAEISREEVNWKRETFGARQLHKDSC